VEEISPFESLTPEKKARLGHVSIGTCQFLSSIKVSWQNMSTNKGQIAAAKFVEKDSHYE
jgi:hypothetical protein